MSIVLSDRIKETTLTEGTADLVLEGSSGGFRTFSKGVGNGKKTYYTIENFGRWEVGIGTYDSGANTLSRDTVLASTDFDAVDGAAIKVTLAGISTVFVTYPAARAVFLDDAGYATSTIPGYLGVKFPDGSTQTYATHLTGTGSEKAIAFWGGSTSFDYDTNLQWDSDTNTLTNQGIIELHPTTGLPLQIKRTSGGNIFHGHVNTGKRLGLHLTGDANPTWTLGLQEGTLDTTVPSQEYVYGGNSSTGMYAATDTGFIINYSNGFWIKHKNAVLFNAGKNGSTVYNDTASAVAVTIKGASAQSASLQEWTDSSSTTLLSVNKDGAMVFDTQIADVDALNSSLYYSSTQNKLSFKDDAGVVNVLY
jgi:hypothetical protein